MNRVGALETDLTRRQFGPEERVGPGEVRVRLPGPPRRCGAQYVLLRARVLAALEAVAPR